jgi:hypothetical protein
MVPMNTGTHIMTTAALRPLRSCALLLLSRL